MCYNQHKGVKNAYTYIYHFEIGKDCHMVMVVDLVDIGIGRWCIWPHSVISLDQIKTPAFTGVFLFYLQLINAHFSNGVGIFNLVLIE